MYLNPSLACVSVCIPSPRVLITNSFIWCDMGPYDKQVLQPLYGSCRVGMTFKFNGVIETNLIRLDYCCISHYFHCKSCLEWLYISKKTGCFIVIKVCVCVTSKRRATFGYIRR